MSECLDAVMFVSLLYRDMMYGTSSGQELIPVDIITDSKSLKDAIKSVKSVSERRLRVDIGTIKEALDNNEINNIQWVNASQQLADCLTKNGASSKQLLQTLRYSTLPG